jgi:hypothetical protein
MDAPKVGEIGALVARLDELEERVARGGEFDQATGVTNEKARDA